MNQLNQLQEDEIKEFYDMADTGIYSQRELADWFGISVSHVHWYLYNREYTLRQYQERKRELIEQTKKGAPSKRNRARKLLNILEVCWANQNSGK